MPANNSGAPITDHFGEHARDSISSDVPGELSPHSLVQQTTIVEATPGLHKWLTSITYSLLFILPVCFGAAHPKIYLSYQVILFAAMAFSIIYSRNIIQIAKQEGQHHSSFKLITFALGSFLLFLCIQTGLLQNSFSPHPILGQVNKLLNWEATKTALFEFLSFGSAFLLVRLLLLRNLACARKLELVLLLSAALCSAIGLIHWFYDNGLLFWTFEPDYVHTSMRTRWPFVSPNHLAQFLLPSFFLFWAHTVRRYYHLEQTLQQLFSQNKHQFKRIASSSRVRTQVFKLLILAFGFCAVSLCIMGSLSRGAWFGLTCATLIWILFHKRIKLLRANRDTISRPPLPTKVCEYSNISDDSKHPPHSSRHQHRRRVHFNSPSRGLNIFGIGSGLKLVFLTIRISIVCTMVLILGLFFHGLGGELFDERLHFGLLYSLEDMRWQLYMDSIPLIAQHLWIGVGLGAWDSYYPQFTSPLLSGINPQYLHSDPLQLLAETGIFGFSLMAALVVALSLEFLRWTRKQTAQELEIGLGLFCGLWALLIASFFDFPFHNTAIVFSLAAQLGLLSFHIDLALKAPHNAVL